MQHSIFAMELCLPLDLSTQQELRGLVLTHPELSGYHEKWTLYRRVSDIVMGHLERVDRGCWDYFDDDARALSEYDQWVNGMTMMEGARTQPSGEADPYRGSPRFMTFTMAFLIVNGSPTDLTLSSLCNIPEPDLWRRGTFARILNGLGAISFASIKSDVVYVIPGAGDWGLTQDDLSHPKFAYLRHVTP